MHIGIDGNLISGNITGMGTVLISVLRYLNVDEKKDTVTVFVPGELEDNIYSELIKNNIRVKKYRKSNYFMWEQLILPRIVKQEHVDVLWCPYNTAPIMISCPVVLTVHDLIFMDLSLKKVQSFYKKLGVIYRKFVVPIAIKKSKKVITISYYSKNEICRFFPNVHNKINVVYNSVEKNIVRLDNKQDSIFFKNNGIKKPYILGFGSLEQRKNTFGLIKAYQSLPSMIKQKFQLVLFGFRGYHTSNEYKYINENKLENIVVLEYISNEEKNTLYHSSEMFVFPSFSEGFGLPILEAFLNNTPVITSNVSALPEIAGSAAILVNPKNVKEISDSIRLLINNEEISREMRLEGISQLNKFDWKQSVEQIYHIFESVTDL